MTRQPPFMPLNDGHNPPSTSAPDVQPYRPANPRKVKGAVKLRLRGPVEALALVPRTWLTAVSSQANDVALVEGEAYARSGQVVRCEALAGLVRAAVQGRAARAYEVTITVGVLDDPAWDTLVQAMAEEAGYAARIMAGEFPDRLLPLAVELNAPLITSAHSITAACTCSWPGPLCKHAMAAAWVMAERLDENPLTLFALRGMAAERLLDRLRHARAVRARATPPPAPAHDPADLEVAPTDLDAAHFWRFRRELMPAALEIGRHVPHALLRRMGPSPMAGRFPMVGLLASVYDTASAKAQALLTDHTPLTP